MNKVFQQLKVTVNRLAPSWGAFLKEKQGLDLQARDLAAELSRPLSVDRSVPGFEDFAPHGVRAVEAGEPSASLLYHALASPDVCPEGLQSSDYPTWAELDAIENYIYAIKPITEADFDGKVVAVFAYQYRPMWATTHQQYADMAYSRLGFARVGNTEPRYVGSSRGYTSYTGVPGEVAVLPARYAAFLAEWRPGTNNRVTLIGEKDADDAKRRFLYPLRKLFPGDECVVGRTVLVEFAESHLSTKLARVVGGAGTPDGKAFSLPPGLDATRPPFLRHSSDSELAIIRSQGTASVSIRPPIGPIVRLAKQFNLVTQQDEIARFIVTPAVVPTMSDVVTAVTQSSALTALVDQTIVAMRKTGQILELVKALGGNLDNSGATAKLTGKPDLKAAALSGDQIKQALASAEELIKSGHATLAELGTAIFLFKLLLTANLLNAEANATTVAGPDKASVLAFVLVQVRNIELNRHYSSLSMVGDLERVLSESLMLLLQQPDRVGRSAPEFVNIRHQVVVPAFPASPADTSWHLQDLNTLQTKSGDDDPFDATLSKGGYEAALFEDGVADGCVAVQVSVLPVQLCTLPAFSVIGAPSLFPRSSDLDLEAWWKIKGQGQFAEGDPQPLAEGRLAANPAILQPGGGEAAFELDDITIAAVMGRPIDKKDYAAPKNRSRKKYRSSFLPDVASNEFYPGWDVTINQDDRGGFFYTTHGLGSPYPEDVKFCSAANGFWPAAAPDSARVFHRLDTPTSIPLLDSELGYHPDSPMVLAKKANSAMGWDGGYGPFFQDKDGRKGVNYASMDRTDYVSNALAGTFGLDLFERLTSEMLIERLEVQKLAITNLSGGKDQVRNTSLWLIVANDVEDWCTESGGDPDLKGHGYFLQFVTAKAGVDPLQLDSAPATQTNRYTRLWQEIGTIYTCRVTTEAIRWWPGSDPKPPQDAKFARAQEKPN